MATTFPGVPAHQHSFASRPTATNFATHLVMATIDGSFTTMPLPCENTSCFGGCPDRWPGRNENKLNTTLMLPPFLFDSFPLPQELPVPIPEVYHWAETMVTTFANWWQAIMHGLIPERNALGGISGVSFSCLRPMGWLSLIQWPSFHQAHGEHCRNKFGAVGAPENNLIEGDCGCFVPATPSSLWISYPSLGLLSSWIPAAQHGEYVAGAPPHASPHLDSRQTRDSASDIGTTLGQFSPATTCRLSDLPSTTPFDCLPLLKRAVGCVPGHRLRAPPRD